jgi:hypothetical protein
MPNRDSKALEGYGDVGRPRPDHWKQRLVHRLGGPEHVPPIIFVALGFAALGLMFTWRGVIFDSENKLIETGIVVATAVLLAGLIQVLTAFVRWWSTRGERDEFYHFFGNGDMLGIVPDIECLDMVVRWVPPQSNGARPKGTNVVPFQDLRAAISLAELFEDYDIPFKISTDTQYNDGTLPLCGFVAIGLGFNKLTCMLSDASRLFEIKYQDTYTKERKDDFFLDGTPHGKPSGKLDYALIVRVPLRMNGKIVPTFVCAGRTAKGTAAAGYFLKNSWIKLYDLYARDGMQLDEDALAVEIEHSPSVIIKSRIGRHRFRALDDESAFDEPENAPVQTMRTEKGDDAEPGCEPRDSVTEHRTARVGEKAALTIPSTNGSDTTRT